MDFQQAVKAVFSNYAGFSGRASRSEFWWFWLFLFCVSAALNVLSLIMGGSTVISVISGIWSLAILVPNIAVCVRRMHDIGKGGGWICINLIPVVGFIWFIVLAAKPGEQAPNRFGVPPVC